jgi:DNA-binding beta-propeller fold protein YncE
VKKNDLPALEIVRLVRDHLGSFDSSEDGVDTPDTQMADNDYALGLLVEKVSKSPYWESTVIVKVEDDAQNGADHVDAHRSFALFAGGHVKRGGVTVSSVYATPSVLRTIELLLSLPPLGQRDALAPPMDDVLTEDADTTPFEAVVPPVLRSTKLPVPRPPGAETSMPRGDRTMWAAATRGFDFKHVDAVPTEQFNRLLFCGLVDATGCTSRATQMTAEGDDDDD